MNVLILSPPVGMRWSRGQAVGKVRCLGRTTVLSHCLGLLEGRVVNGDSVGAQGTYVAADILVYLACANYSLLPIEMHFVAPRRVPD